TTTPPLHDALPISEIGHEEDRRAVRPRRLVAIETRLVAPVDFLARRHARARLDRVADHLAEVLEAPQRAVELLLPLPDGFGRGAHAVGIAVGEPFDDVGEAFLAHPRKTPFVPRLHREHRAELHGQAHVTL